MKKTTIIAAAAIIFASTTSVWASDIPEGMGVLPTKVPVPADNLMSQQKVKLGKQLYFDPAVSKSGHISCNSCHNLASWGVDNQVTSIGHKWQRGGRNAPTVLNSAFWSKQFWDGRAPLLEDQAKGPPLNPVALLFSLSFTSSQRADPLSAISALSRSSVLFLIPKSLRP